MKKNKHENHQKRLETKRTNRNKRKNRKKNEPRIEWITDTMFTIHCDDKRIRNLFPSITIEVVDGDYEFSKESSNEASFEDSFEDISKADQSFDDHIQSEIYEINKIYSDMQNMRNMKKTSLLSCKSCQCSIDVINIFS